MTDDELSNLLQEWKPTPAPPSLKTRVFGSRRLPSSSMWDKIPGSLVAITGAAAGVLGVWGLITATTQWIHPAPAAVVEQATPLAAEKSIVKEPPLLPSINKATPRSGRTKPVAAPAPPSVATVSPRLLNGPEPVYPAGAPLLVSTTTVKLRIRVGKDGRVIDASVIEGDPLLDPLAIEAVKGWLYEPWLLNGEPAEVVTEVNVTFEPKPKKK